ncbi:hypothetical protein ELG97_04680 [Rhizobium leguminosarum]|nr:hypothetical protein ELG97_04680 [Rhizobium leguminosarum]
MKSARALGFATSRHLHHVPGHDRSESSTTSEARRWPSLWHPAFRSSFRHARLGQGTDQTPAQSHSAWRELSEMFQEALHRVGQTATRFDFLVR